MSGTPFGLLQLEGDLRSLLQQDRESYDCLQELLAQRIVDGGIRKPVVCPEMDAQGDSRTYRTVAALGLASTASDEWRDQYYAGLKWLVGRSPSLVGSRAPFVSDVLALLALAYSANALGDEAAKDELKSWMLGFLDLTAATALTPEEAALFVGTRRLLGVDRPAPMAEPCLTTLYSLECVGILPTCTITLGDAASAISQRLQRSFQSDSLSRPFLLTAIHQLLAAEVVGLELSSTDRLVSLLEKIERSLAIWTWETETGRSGRGPARRWHIDNEYHVQCLAWAILAPLFSDLKREDYTPKIGPYQPRADIGIPSMKTIVELKYWRTKTKAADIIEEVAADASIYFSEGSAYSQMIPLIWDDAARVEEHADIRAGLKLLNGIPDAVIVSRPSRLREDC